MRIGRVIVLGLGGLALAAMGWLAGRFLLGRCRAEQAWASVRPQKLKDVGAVKRLSILPLVDGRAADDGLAAESGVSYLVDADDMTILFDVGLNGRGEHPSPLLRNMEAFGVDVREIDAIVISHLHLDHVGGMASQRKRTFALSGEPVDLGGKRAFVPTPMTHPTARIEVVDGPRVIAPGVASTGPIPRQLFFFGWTPEQTLAVNVQGKGIVLVVGCGHPTIQRIVERVEALFDAPLYGVVGGLHYPVTARTRQRVLGSDSWPWCPIGKQDVEASIAFLQSRRPRLVALSPHDSCAWSIAAFRQAFGVAYRDVLVGKEIMVE